MAKLNWNTGYGEVHEITVGGQTLHVKERIPFAERSGLAGEYVNRVVRLENNGFASASPWRDTIWDILVLKYYTDAEIGDGDDWGTMGDWMEATGCIEAVSDICGKQMANIRFAAERLLETTMDSWRHDHSFEAALANATSDETLQMIAQMQPVQDEILRALKPEKKNTVTQFPGFAKKK